MNMCQRGTRIGPAVLEQERVLELAIPAITLQAFAVNKETDETLVVAQLRVAFHMARGFDDQLLATVDAMGLLIRLNRTPNRIAMRRWGPLDGTHIGVKRGKTIGDNAHQPSAVGNRS